MEWCSFSLILLDFQNPWKMGYSDYVRNNYGIYDFPFLYDFLRVYRNLYKILVKYITVIVIYESNNKCIFGLQQYSHERSYFFLGLKPLCESAQQWNS